MNSQIANKNLAIRWFGGFWGENYSPAIVDEIAGEEMTLEPPLHKVFGGRDDIKEFMTGFREAFPDFQFRIRDQIIAERDFVMVPWEGGGTHTGPSYRGLAMGWLPKHTGRSFNFSGIVTLHFREGRLIEDKSYADCMTALKQLGLLKRAYIQRGPGLNSF